MCGDNCLGEATMDRLTRAIEMQTEKIEKLTDAVNNTGEIADRTGLAVAGIMDIVQGFASTFGRMGPGKMLGLLKGIGG